MMIQSASRFRIRTPAVGNYRSSSATPASSMNVQQAAGLQHLFTKQSRRSFAFYSQSFPFLRSQQQQHGAASYRGGMTRRTMISCTYRHFSTPTKSNHSTNNSAYWNRETSRPKDFDATVPIVQEARILSLTDPDDSANDPVNKAHQDPTVLPKGANVLAIGASSEDFDIPKLKEQKPNVLFVSHPNAREPLAYLLQELPSLEWVHARSAGLDFITSQVLAQAHHVTVTNAKGTFSSTLAEYSMLACSYFAKDLPRLLRQKSEINWERYPILELRGATLGVVGYGDIGKACARLATAYGMRVVAVKRHPPTPEEVENDPYCDAVYGNDTVSVNQLFAESDYVVVSAPLTEETRGMIGKEQLEHAKKDCVLINVGRGPVIDENAMVEALKNGNLKGAGLDVFSTGKHTDLRRSFEFY